MRAWEMAEAMQGVRERRKVRRGLVRLREGGV
jgi:hypothetical protein